MTENTPNTLKPIGVINENVSPVNVARYYLEIELLKLFKKSTEIMAESIKETVQNLSESKVWALLEAMSFTYHLNGVFYNISRDNYTWKEEVWHVRDLILIGMDSKANKVISEKVNGDAFKFNKLIMKEQDGKIQMLDGSHRLTEMLLANIEEVVAYVGHPITKKAEEKPISRIGNSTFILLTIMFKQGNSEERKSVVMLVKQLIRNSVDGRDAVQKYWVDVQRDEEIKEAGITILNNSQT